MILNNDWRLTPTLVAFIVSSVESRLIYLAAPEKKQYRVAVSKMISAPYKEINIELNEFEIKFCKEDPSIQSPCVYIRNASVLPDDGWYRVGNFSKNFFDFFLELKSDKGEFPGVLFEAVFSESSPTLVTFTAPGMQNYKAYLEEMTRRLNCEVKKKSKKWVPGHRYDTLKETYIYLGEVVSRRKDDSDSEFLPDSEMVSAYLYVNAKRDSDKTISNVLTNGKFGKDEFDIKVLYSLPSAVDSGKVLEGEPIKDISIYWKNMMDNALASNTLTDAFGRTSLSYARYIFDPLCYQSIDCLEYNREDITSLVTEVIHKLTEDFFQQSWNVDGLRKDMAVSSSRSESENLAALMKGVIFYTQDINTSRYSYYTDLMSALGIDLKAQLTKELCSWNEADLLKDFETYMKNNAYFSLRKNQVSVTSRQRVDSSPYDLDVITIESIFGKGELTETIKSLVDFSRDNFGTGVTKFILYNVGTKKDPKEYVSIEISLLDIINWYKGVENLSETLKAELMDQKFTKVYVVIDKNRTVE